MAVFRGASNVAWMDTLNRTYEGAAPTSEYVIRGVDLYGIDAYYASAVDTFESVFGETISQIRAVTDKPVMINLLQRKPGNQQPVSPELGADPGRDAGPARQPGQRAGLAASATTPDRVAAGRSCSASRLALGPVRSPRS
jgi:hypothetical protein